MHAAIHAIENNMKQEIHPPYHPAAVMTCACGATRTVGSTQETAHVELCSQCHPFYTGKQKLVDTARRVEKFQERGGKKVTTAAARKGKQAKRAKLTRIKKEKVAKAEREE